MLMKSEVQKGVLVRGWRWEGWVVGVGSLLFFDMKPINPPLGNWGAASKARTKLGTQFKEAPAFCNGIAFESECSSLLLLAVTQNSTLGSGCSQLGGAGAPGEPQKVSLFFLAQCKLMSLGSAHLTTPGGFTEKHLCNLCIQSPVTQDHCQGQGVRTGRPWGLSPGVGGPGWG